MKLSFHIWNFHFIHEISCIWHYLFFVPNIIDKLFNHERTALNNSTEHNQGLKMWWWTVYSCVVCKKDEYHPPIVKIKIRDYLKLRMCRSMMEKRDETFYHWLSFTHYRSSKSPFVLVGAYFCIQIAANPRWNWPTMFQRLITSQRNLQSETAEQFLFFLLCWKW